MTFHDFPLLPPNQSVFPPGSRIGPEDWHILSPEGEVVCPSDLGAWSGRVTWSPDRLAYVLNFHDSEGPEPEEIEVRVDPTLLDDAIASLGKMTDTLRRLRVLRGQMTAATPKVTRLVDKFQVDVKRFHLPFEVSQGCPACGVVCTRDLRRDYVDYPTLRESHDVHGYCDACGHAWPMNIVIDIVVKPA